MLQEKKFLTIYISEKWNCFYTWFIYTRGTDKEAGDKNTFFNTIQVKAMMEFIHNNKKRMYLILYKEDITVWIDPESPKGIVSNLMKSFDKIKMREHTISKNASCASNNRNFPEIKVSVLYNENTIWD